ncbi:DUF349 domain-containing protein [Microbacterium sp.]|uniref:DUF349 domain-containing protein n=1 Tax=Microbacterium sp. TaxID=51671 RepID=UPI002CFCD52E|nr:DUF349 domain-containing protein [Microbacterium sp.]HWL77525.1 DUF349 domain-containing protein [Microbacterium sp.]
MTSAAESTPETPDDLDAEAVSEQPTVPDEQTPEAPDAATASEEASETAASEEAASESEPAADTAAASGDESDAAAAAETTGDAEQSAEETDAAAAPDAALSAAPAAEPTGGDEPWGRVDDDGTVYVREGAEWREVGQFPDGTREEALAYFERKYNDLASEVTLLEVRHRRGGASASDLRATARTLHDKFADAAAVGDLASLRARLDALTEELSAASASEAAAARQAVEDAVKARTELVERAEALAARDPKTIQWKQTSAEIAELFEQWQSQQQHGPRLPKSTSQQLWKRFRDARATLDKARREFYAQLDEAHKAVRERKSKLVEKAEALAPKGEDGIAAYRELLEQWKTAGRAGKKADDALWARFKAAGDVLYAARSEREAAEAEASREKIEARRALLEEAKAIQDERDLAKARSMLTSIQRRWDDLGRIFPRDVERSLDDELRKIEQALRAREDADWKSNNPETKARANDMTRQLTEAIEKLEQELAAAEKAGDKAAAEKAKEALEARRTWLKALGG